MTLKFATPIKAFFLVAALAGTCLSASAALPERISSALERAGIRPESVSLYAVTADTGEVLLEHEPDRPMRSASLMKLLTTYAALELLGPAWTWPTEAYAETLPQGGTLDGPLILKGYGDPALTLERFWLLTRQLRQNGIQHIRGGLLIDQSHFGPPPGAPDRLDWPWEVVPGPLMVNFQATRLFFERQSNGVSLRAEPDLGWQFHLDLPVVEGPCMADVEDSWWPRMDWLSTPPTATIRGTFPSGCDRRELNIGVTDPLYYHGALFRALWESQGGTLSGDIREGQASASAVRVARIESPPLPRALTDMNKFSNNAMARLIYQTIGKRYATAEDASIRDAADRAIRVWLRSKGLEFAELVQETGSGLSRRESLSSRHWVQLLHKASGGRYAAELIASLPVAGVDGTMSRRLRNEAAMGWGHFKTGTLSDTKSLAGFLTSGRGRPMIMAVQINEADLGRRADLVLEDIVRLLFEDDF